MRWLTVGIREVDAVLEPAKPTDWPLNHKLCWSVKPIQPRIRTEILARFQKTNDPLQDLRNTQ